MQCSVTTGLHEHSIYAACYLFSGSDDPLHRRQTGIRRLIDCWSSAGIRVDQHIYEGVRHESLNDVFFDEVPADLIDWLNKAVLGSE